MILIAVIIIVLLILFASKSEPFNLPFRKPIGLEPSNTATDCRGKNNKYCDPVPVW